MNHDLIQKHLTEKSAQGFTRRKYDTFFDGKVLQICFYSTGCRFSKNGSCIMCDFGKPRKVNLTPNDIHEIMQKVFANLAQPPKVLLLNSLGSVLDEMEMPHANLVALLDEIAQIETQVIIFETHYFSINQDILQLVKQKLPQKEIVIEMGFESANAELRQKYLNKMIDNDRFVEKVNLIKSFGFDAEANVLFGMPFLATDAQIADALQSIIWCFEHGLDKVNLFPMNIKPYTLLYVLYKNGEYAPVRHADFIKVLQQIPEKYLEQIYLCWYGNRELDYDEGLTVFPTCAESERDKIMDFYQDFNLHKDQAYRAKLLGEVKLF